MQKASSNDWKDRNMNSEVCMYVYILHDTHIGD